MSTIASVKEQTYRDIEHVFVDGVSTDRTLALIRSAGPARIISEPDAGIYDAMQKGVGLATGDVLYFLNSGDVLADESVVADVIAFFKLTGAHAVFGNLLPSAGSRHNHPMYKAGRSIDQGYFGNRQLFFDESIHHQTIFYRREIFARCGYLCEEPAASGEYLLNMCAFVHEGFLAKHLPRIIARFALGGHSTSDFATEWGRFVVARDILRYRFFPDGIGRSPQMEYLHYPPSLKNRLKLLARDRRLRWLLVGARHLRNGLSRSAERRAMFRL